MLWGLSQAKQTRTFCSMLDEIFLHVWVLQKFFCTEVPRIPFNVRPLAFLQFYHPHPFGCSHPCPGRLDDLVLDWRGGGGGWDQFKRMGWSQDWQQHWDHTDIFLSVLMFFPEVSACEPWSHYKTGFLLFFLGTQMVLNLCDGTLTSTGILTGLLADSSFTGDLHLILRTLLMHRFGDVFVHFGWLGRLLWLLWLPPPPPPNWALPPPTVCAPSSSWATLTVSTSF